MGSNRTIPSDIPAMWGHCLKADCRLADSCLRQLAMQNDRTESVWLRMLNPAIASGEADCPYYVDAGTPRFARGLSFNFDDVPYGKVKDFKAELQDRFSKMKLSRMTRGLCLISPADQETLHRLCAKHDIPEPVYAEFTFSWED